MKSLEDGFDQIPNANYLTRPIDKYKISIIFYYVLKKLISCYSLLLAFSSKIIYYLFKVPKVEQCEYIEGIHNA